MVPCEVLLSSAGYAYDPPRLLIVACPSQPGPSSQCNFAMSYKAYGGADLVAIRKCVLKLPPELLIRAETKYRQLLS